MVAKRTTDAPAIVEPLNISLDDVAKLLGVSRDTVRRLCETRGLPRYQVGGRLKFVREEVVAWFKEQRSVTFTTPESPGDGVALKRESSRPSRMVDFKDEAREMMRRRKRTG